MRQKFFAAIVVIALAGAIAISVTGQEDPLPVVAPQYPAPAVTIVEPLVVLAAEPVREYQPPTLADAARNNDFLTFDALYAAAQKRGEDVSRFATLHELWSYSIADPIGAFYGVELYARLSRAYPGFAAYIEPYRIVDSNGQIFYPTSETRTFLLVQAVEQRPTPKVLVAEKTTAPVARNTTPAKPKPAPVIPSVARDLAPPAAATPTPTSVAPASDDTVVVEKPIAQPTPQTVAPAQPAPAAQPAVTPKTSPATTRGILLLVIGLIGVGLLAVILRTPREEPMVIKPNQPPGNVEPLRKPQAAPPPPPGSRADGPHGDAAAG